MDQAYKWQSREYMRTNKRRKQGENVKWKMEKERAGQIEQAKRSR